MTGATDEQADRRMGAYYGIGLGVCFGGMATYVGTDPVTVAALGFAGALAAPILARQERRQEAGG